MAGGGFPGHGGDSLTGGRETSLALKNPSQIPFGPLPLAPGAGSRGGRGGLGDHGTRGAAVGTGADGGMVFGPADVSDAVGNRDDQGGLRRVLPLAARRLAK